MDLQQLLSLLGGLGGGGQSRREYANAASYWANATGELSNDPDVALGQAIRNRYSAPETGGLSRNMVQLGQTAPDYNPGQTGNSNWFSSLLSQI